MWTGDAIPNGIYLTFDDGPHPEHTPFVLDILKKYGFKASFFCIGDNMYKYPEIVERILEEGHVLGNHTYNHLSGFKHSNSVYLNNISKWSEKFRTDLFRPPYGRIRRSQIKALKKEYKIVMWTLLTWDFKKNLHVERLQRKLQKKTKDGAIVVFHDSDKAAHNLYQLLPVYCAFLHENKYQSLHL
jgi:peptidoglycan/xylan/chitin deacetylase (PgdA/CDA1 family)